MVGNIPVRSDHNPFTPVQSKDAFDDSIRLVTDPGIDNPNPLYDRLMLPRFTRLPPVKNYRDVVTFPFPVLDKRFYKLLPLLPEIPMSNTGKVIAVDDKKGNGILRYGYNIFSFDSSSAFLVYQKVYFSFTVA